MGNGDIVKRMKVVQRDGRARELTSEEVLELSKKAEKELGTKLRDVEGNHVGDTGSREKGKLVGDTGSRDKPAKQSEMERETIPFTEASKDRSDTPGGVGDRHASFLDTEKESMTQHRTDLLHEELNPDLKGGDLRDRDHTEIESNVRRAGGSDLTRTQEVDIGLSAQSRTISSESIPDQRSSKGLQARYEYEHAMDEMSRDMLDKGSLDDFVVNMEEAKKIIDLAHEDRGEAILRLNQARTQNKKIDPEVVMPMVDAAASVSQTQAIKGGPAEVLDRFSEAARGQKQPNPELDRMLTEFMVNISERSQADPAKRTPELMNWVESIMTEDAREELRKTMNKAA